MCLVVLQSSRQLYSSVPTEYSHCIAGGDSGWATWEGRGQGRRATVLWGRLRSGTLVPWRWLYLSCLWAPWASAPITSHFSRIIWCCWDFTTLKFRAHKLCNGRRGQTTAIFFCKFLEGFYCGNIVTVTHQTAQFSHWPHKQLHMRFRLHLWSRSVSWRSPWGSDAHPEASCLLFRLQSYMGLVLYKLLKF